MSSSLIAEIGGTSSRWALLQENGTELIFPGADHDIPGYNPLTGSGDMFIDGIRSYFEKNAPEVLQAGELKVYGAGCGTAERRERMRQVLQQIWPDITIMVDSDLHGAAMALCGGDKGLVVILGTGMNLGYYDGQHLHRPMPSLGYILGDEGSGADIGRMLIQDAFYRRMPDEVKHAVFGASGPDLQTILDEVYRSPFPARMLASRTARLAPLLEHNYVREAILSRFHAFADIVKTFFSLEQREMVYATGSVAYGFRELLGECLLDHGMNLVNVVKDPLRGLIARERQLHGRPGEQPQ